MERLVAVIVGLALLFGVRSAYNKVVSEAVKPQPIPEFVSFTPILPVDTLGPLILPTPNIPRGLGGSRGGYIPPAGP